MTYSSTRFLVFFTIFLVSLQCGCGALFKRKLVYVQMTNRVPGQVNLTIHCKSGDEDLGSHVLAPEGHWGFQFRPNFWKTTLYFCSFQWPGNFHYFDIYKKAKSRPGCHDCFWNVGPDGPCLFDYDTKGYGYCEPWNPPVPSLTGKPVL
ncbi:hypothetical protein ACJRO7_000257 [Eucalyptus globulus]|uniref:S-protein homolog n=1 Tax=Eucalyptus globulus TaxID=34317 RepID=A0ABD3LQC2_EUCGL